MGDWIVTQLTAYGISAQYIEYIAAIVGFSLLWLLALVCFYVVKHRIIVFIQAAVKQSKNQWDDALFTHKVFSRTGVLVPFFIVLIFGRYFIDQSSTLTVVMTVFAKAVITIQVARIMCALLDVIKSLYHDKAYERYLPLSSAIQLIKLAIYVVAAILTVAIIIDRSPIYLLSGLGALTAVLLLVFQDTIKGFVASIQISANKMVAPGDWVELPQYGADGDVLEIGLNTVKIQNFDRTVTTVPTYALISGSFKNWRDMFNSGGRRIKRAVNVDIRSIRFYKEDDIEHLKSINYIAKYLVDKQSELLKSAQEKGVAANDQLNHRQLTNIGTFRAYIEAYLKQHEKVHKEMTCMVRQLPATPTGVPLELYFFSNDQNWVSYEAIQADIFDHIYAIAPVFELRLFQHPTGFDWQRN